jgi:hypothetical protein
MYAEKGSLPSKRKDMHLFQQKFDVAIKQIRESHWGGGKKKNIHKSLFVPELS